MDIHERREVHRLVKYCRQNTKLVVQQGMEHGRLNKRALMRAGMTRLEIENAIERLRKKLEDYNG